MEMYRELRIVITKGDSPILEFNKRRTVEITLIEGDCDHQREYVLYKLSGIEVDSVTVNGYANEGMEMGTG